MSARTIGRTAREADVNVETIRFYERKGLLEKPPTPSSGFREYSEEHVRRIRFIKRAQQIGFTLAETAELLSISAQGSCAEVRGRAETKLGDIAAKISELERMQRALRDVVSRCASNEELSDCPVLDALDGRPWPADGGRPSG